LPAARNAAVSPAAPAPPTATPGALTPPLRSPPAATVSSRPLDRHGGAVAQHLGDALHHLVRVVAHAHHGVGAQLRRVIEHEIEGLLTRLLAQLGEERDVAAEDGLER